MEESRKRQDRFCIKTLHYIFHEITFVFFCTKRYFLTQVKYYKFQFEIQNTRHYFQLEETIS